MRNDRPSEKDEKTFSWKQPVENNLERQIQLALSVVELEKALF